jgi:biotin carboxyl carrier protein
MDKYNEVKRDVNEAAELVVQCQAELATYQEEVNRLEGERANYVVTAPFSGKVTRICQYAGQYVQPGEVILEMESTEKQVRASVPQELASKIHGLTFHVEVQNGERVELAVAEVSLQGTTSGFQSVVFDLKDAAQLISNQSLAVYVNDGIESAVPGFQVAQTFAVH